MAVDLTLQFREALIPFLRGNAELTNLIDASAIYGERVPEDHAWPFIRLGFPDASPFSATGIDGNIVEFRLHTFTRSEDTSLVLQINATLVRILDEAQLDMTEGWNFDIAYTRSSVTRDTAEATAFHGLVDFTALVGVDA